MPRTQTLADAAIAWIGEEQTTLWDDLGDAIRDAANGRWSIRAGHVARRIVEAARIAGPSDHGEIPWELVAGGVYEAVLSAGGVEFNLPDDAEWRRLDVLMIEHGGTRAVIRPQMAGTVAAIRSDRETAWIAGTDE